MHVKIVLASARRCELDRRARSVMSRLGVPIVDAASIVEGEAWASKTADGRHYHPIVPIEVGGRRCLFSSSCCLLGLLLVFSA